MRRDDVKERFIEILGKNEGSAYISSVLIAVAGNERLQQCSANSIIGSALRAATLKLSVDPSTGQAYLVPFRDKATLIVGYKGIYNLALRTGKYRYLTVNTIYKDDRITEDDFTGIHKLERGELHLSLAHEQPEKKESQIAGYLLYFELVSGFKKTFYMTVEECIAHGKKYSKSFSRSDSLWKTEAHKMYKKTVIRMGLLKWGYLDPSDAMALNVTDEQDDEDMILPDHTEGGVTVDGPLTASDTMDEKIIHEIMANLDYQGNTAELKRPDELEAHINGLAENYKGKKATQVNRNILFGCLKLCFVGEDLPADGSPGRRIIEHLSHEKDLKNVADALILAMLEWINPSQDSGGAWAPSTIAVWEAKILYAYLDKKSNNQEILAGMGY
jgi:recombination protein RecT